MSKLVAQRYLQGPTVGTGSYSIVSNARDTQENRPVALKKIKMKSNITTESAKQAQDAFFKESRFLMGLKHPLFPEYLDAFMDGSDYYLAIEWLDGKNLIDIIERGGKIDEKTALRYMDLICDGLDYMHDRRRLIYRGINPWNIRQDSQGNIKIIDFGTARIFSVGRGEVIRASEPHVFSPPEATGGDSKLDYSADIYALGATIYFLMTGKDPNQSRGDLQTLDTLVPTVSKEFSALVHDCLKPQGKRIPDTKVLRGRIAKLFGTGKYGVSGRSSLQKMDTIDNPIFATVTLLIALGLGAAAYTLTKFDMTTLLTKVSLLLAVPYIVAFTLDRMYSLGRLVIKKEKRVTATTDLFKWTGILAVCSLAYLAYFQTQEPEILKQRDMQRFVGCQENMKTIAAALDTYFKENGKFPADLSSLAPKYIAEIPACPMAGKDTYSLSYRCSDNGYHFEFYCNGANHQAFTPVGNWPRYEAFKGLLLGP